MPVMVRRSLESLVAGVAVYAFVAACSGGGGAAGHVADGGAGGPVAAEGGQPARGGAPSQTGAGMSSAGSPVPDAMAAGGGEGECGCPAVEVKEPTVVEAKCDQQAEGSPSLWAVAEFPGKTAIELARVVALIDYPDGIYKWPAGFVSQSSTVWAQDGSVTVACGSHSAPSAVATRVRFVLP